MGVHAMLLNEKLKVLIEGKFGNLEMHFGKSGDASYSLQ